MDLIFLNCIDLEKPINALVVVDPQTKKLLIDSLNVIFDGNIAFKDGTTLRKEIMPKIKDYIEKSPDY